MSDESRVTYHQGDDPEILAASQRARDTFRHFFHEVALDYNRIVPALTLACMKVPFSDDDDLHSSVEHMWVDHISFDGELFSGVLINEPNELETVKQGDEVSFPLDQVGDWLLMIGDTVYGGHTIQVIRSRMPRGELKDYDAAWGLPFPDEVLLPEHNHKFENVIADGLTEQIAKDATLVEQIFDDGLTLLHMEALFGRLACVKVLLDNGASTTVQCDRGWTPLDYAKSGGWEEVTELLEAAN